MPFEAPGGDPRVQVAQFCNDGVYHQETLAVFCDSE